MLQLDTVPNGKPMAVPVPVGANQFAIQAVFSQAISTNQVDVVQQLLSQEPSLATAVGWHGQTELHKACSFGMFDCVKLLINAGADPNARTNFNETPIHYSCKRGLAPVVHYLLTHGGDVTLIDNAGKGAHHYAAEAGSVQLLAMLEAMYPDMPFTCQDLNLQTPLHLTIKGQHLEAFNFLLRKRKGVNKSDRDCGIESETKADDKSTIIHEAHDVSTCRSNLRCADKDGNWPIHISAQLGYGHMTWLQLSVMGLSAMDQPNSEGSTPYQLAASYDGTGHMELMQELNWIKRHPGASITQHATQIWYYYLLLPFVTYGAAIIATQVFPIFQALLFAPALAVNMYAMRSSFHRLHHVSRYPHPYFMGAFAAGISHTIVIEFYLMIQHMGDYVILSMVAIACVVSLVTVYVRLIIKDPGILRKSAEDEMTGKVLTIMDVCCLPNNTNYCLHCELVQPKKTKHCRLCEVCTVDMDHHCLFLLRCIARGNHCLFVWLLILCVVCMSFFLFSCYVYVTVIYMTPTMTLSWFSMLWRILESDCWMASLLILNALSDFWCISMLVFQYHMISNGYTQYFAPKRYHGNMLSCYEKMLNVVNFLMNRRARIVNPSLKVYEQSAKV